MQGTVSTCTYALTCMTCMYTSDYMYSTYSSKNLCMKAHVVVQDGDVSLSPLVNQGNSQGLHCCNCLCTYSEC